MPAARTWSSRAPMILAAVVSAVLLATVLLINRTVTRARAGAVRGVGNGFVVAGREQLRRPARLDIAALQAFLDEQRADGLRYVGVLDDDGRVRAAAGEPRGKQFAPGLYLIGDRARLVNPTPRAGKPRPRNRPGADALVYEFDTPVANQLRDDARWLLIVAIVASTVVLLLALWLSRGLRAREHLQAELERGRRLAALGEMSAVLSHELRNPLASLKGHAQLLVELIGDAGPGNVKAKAERVVGESVRLEALANDLLEFVRSGALHPAEVSPAGLVAEAAAEIGAARIDVDAVGAPATWRLDPARMRQVLVNLLRNALQASPADGRVSVEIGAEADRLVITVRDRGAGIPPGEEASIFEPFHTRRVKGVGLGLAIARQVVELHRGTIEAGNHPDGGARFRVALPRSS